MVENKLEIPYVTQTNPSCANSTFVFDLFVFDLKHMTTLMQESVPSFTEGQNISYYARVLQYVCDVINMSILNYSVYIDPLKFGKHKLCNIIENTVFTQLINTENNNTYLEFKTKLRHLFAEFKQVNKPVPKAKKSAEPPQ
jgi:hypothetical protein